MIRANIWRPTSSISLSSNGLSRPLSRHSESRMCLWPLCIYIWWYITFFAFYLGPGRKQGSDKLAWILHRSAQFHGCCRYTFCSMAHSLKGKFSTQLDNKFTWVRTTKCHYLSKLHSKHSVLRGEGGVEKEGRSGTWRNYFFQYVLHKISTH